MGDKRREMKTIKVSPKLPENNGKLIISIYDYTGNWVQDYIDNGYPVFLWDKEKEGDICERFCQLMQDVEIAKEEYPGLYVHGMFFAPPCQVITKSSNRFWNNRYLQPFEDEDERAVFENPTVLAQTLVEMSLHAVDVFKPNFWVLENPPGRMETLVPKIAPYRKMTFHPHEFGDPYKKQTVLWGEFNTNLPRTPVLPLLKDHIANMSGNRARARSATPRGFAKAFFKANP